MKVQELSIEEINFHLTSFCDRRGRVFWWEGKLYRGITEEYANFYQKLFADGIVQKLVENNLLIKTKLTNLTLKGYPLVIEHQCLPFVSYASEWCPEMLKDAALLSADLTLELTKHNLALSDISTFDILFDGCRPIFVDFCSIVTADRNTDRSWKRFRDDFNTYFLQSLRLMSQGYGDLARWLLADYDRGVMLDYVALMSHRQSILPTTSKNLLAIAKRKIPYLNRASASTKLKAIASTLSPIPPNDRLYGHNLIQRLRQELESIPLATAPTSKTEDDKSYNLPLNPSEQWTQKQLCIHKTLSHLRPATVLDLGSNRGWFSQLAASLGSKVVAADIDEQIVNVCYREAIAKDLPILSLVLNLRDPSPGYGACNKLVAPAVQRLPCDLVLALSLVHLLAFNQHVTFEQISETFALFSKKWLIVEFVSRTSQEIRQDRAEWHPWYTLENFIAALKKWFPNVSIISPTSTLESNPILLCEKIVDG